MRLGIVRGQVVLSVAVPELLGTTLLLVEPVTTDNLEARSGAGGGRVLVVADHLSPGVGEMIGIVEGAEAANAYHPKVAPVDAYCALIVRDYEFKPPQPGSAAGVEG
jgi:microcompartment protein CcmK/EutM